MTVPVQEIVSCLGTWMPTTKAAWLPARLGVSRLALPGTVLKAVSLALRITVPWMDTYQVSLQPNVRFSFPSLQPQRLYPASANLCHILAHSFDICKDPYHAEG